MKKFLNKLKKLYTSKNGPFYGFLTFVLLIIPFFVKGLGAILAAEAVALAFIAIVLLVGKGKSGQFPWEDDNPFDESDDNLPRTKK